MGVRSSIAIVIGMTCGAVVGVVIGSAAPRMFAAQGVPSRGWATTDRAKGEELKKKFKFAGPTSVNIAPHNADDARPGELKIDGDVVVGNPGTAPRFGRKQDETYNIVLTVTDRGGQVVIDEKIGQHVDKYGKGNYRTPIHVSRKLPPGDYVVKLSLAHPTSKLFREDGTVIGPYILAGRGHKMTVR